MRAAQLRVLSELGLFRIRRRETQRPLSQQVESCTAGRSEGRDQ